MLIAALSLVLLHCTWTHAYEEHAHFCIENEPLLLSEMEPQLVKSSGAGPECQITARTLTDKEKESFLDTMCKDHGSTDKDNYQYFKLHNGELSGRGSYHDICNNNATSVLAWLPYKTILVNYAAELNPKERVSYIAKATSLERGRTELCHFRHADLVNGISDNLFTCVVMIFEDNFYGVEDNINVLVELQPLMYQLRNINYMPWRNVSNSYKTHLGDSKLRNPSGERKPIYGTINYAYVEKIRVNTTFIFELNNLTRLPVLFEHRGSVLELDANGVGGMDVQEKAYFGRTMDARSEVQLQVIGQWAEQLRQFSADIFEYYGKGIRHFRQKLKSAELTFVRIDSTEPVFESPESSNLAKATVFREMKSSPARLSVNGSTDAEWQDFDEDDEDDAQGDGHPYPGLYPWFVVSCLIVGAALVLVLYSIVRSYSKRNADKQKYELTRTDP